MYNFSKGIMRALINKKSLKRICDEIGVTDKFLSEKCNISIEKIMRVLDCNNNDLPSFAQAKEIAYRLHVPFAGLYMEPEDLPLPQLRKHKIINYRNMFLLDEDSSHINLAICDLLVAREELIKLSELLDESTGSLNLKAPNGKNVLEWAEYIRNHFDIDIEIQKSFKSRRKLFLYLREKIEEKGVFVSSFTGVPIEDVRGIAVFDEMPIIGINDSDRYPSKTFSLIHELVHILQHQSATCNEMIATFSHNAEEVFCNAVAAEVLVPGKELTQIVDATRNLASNSYENLQKYADAFSVSREVIARRLLDYRFITRDEYDVYTRQLQKEYNESIVREREEARKARLEGRQYGFPRSQGIIAADRNSTAYCKALCKGYYNEILTKQDISRSLNIRTHNVDKFIAEVGRWER